MDKKIKTILCYGDSNTWGWVPGKMGIERFEESERWTGILSKKLVENYRVIEEGLGGRNTAFDDPRPEMPMRNGLQTLPFILESHSPIDMVILMLGTTDCKEIMNLTSEDIAGGMERLVLEVKGFKEINGRKIEKILVIAPPVINESAEFASKLFKGGYEKGEMLRSLYEKISIKNNCMFLDSNLYAKVDPEEGVHLTKSSHQNLALEVFNKIIS